MKKKIGLVPKLIMGIIAGILIGSFAPEFLVRILVTASGLFSASKIRYTIYNNWICNCRNS